MRAGEAGQLVVMASLAVGAVLGLVRLAKFGTVAWEPETEAQRQARMYAEVIRVPMVVSRLPETGTEGDMVYLTTNRHLYHWEGGGWVAPASAAGTLAEILARAAEVEHARDVRA